MSVSKRYGPKGKTLKPHDVGKRKIPSIVEKSPSESKPTTELPKPTNPPKPKPRYTITMPKREHLFKVRNSLAEFVDFELTEQGTSVYYQRVFILAKNVTSNIGGRRDGSAISAITTATVATVQSAFAEETAVATAAGTVVGDISMAPTPAGTVFTGPVSPVSPAEIAALPPPPQLLVGDEEKLTKTYTFISTEDVAEENSPPPEDNILLDKEKPRDFFNIFMDKLEELCELCSQNTYTPDPLSGLFLYMGDYTMLMIESSEDIIGAFCKELCEISSLFWLKDRIFQIEDKISETYFSTIIGRRIPAAFINEKFPTSTPNDEYLMAKQHVVIKEKLNLICRMLSDDLKEWQQQQEQDEESSSSSFITERTRQQTRISENLPLEPYRRLLPELQRIELVLSSIRFYFTLDEFSLIYGTVPGGHDDEGLFWPEPNNYLPPNIFQRSEFDVNLTFGDYGKDLLRQSEDSHRKSSLVDGGEPKGEDEPADGNLAEKKE